MRLIFVLQDALSTADHLLSFKMTAKAIASQNGLYASFMPKPFQDQSGNGLHINLSLSKGGENLFQQPEGRSEDMESFIAGILERVREITVFLNPLTNSYRRLGAFEAPKYITWSPQNRSQLIRIPASTKEHTRIELRSADAACNPYLAFALLLHAGLDGIQRHAKLAPPCNENLYDIAGENGEYASLPDSLEQAVESAKESDFLSRILPEEILHRYLEEKEREAESFKREKDPWEYEYRKYFTLI